MCDSVLKKILDYLVQSATIFVIRGVEKLNFGGEMAVLVKR